MAFGGGGGNRQGGNQQQAAPQQIYEVSGCPDDTVSDVNIKGNRLVASSWSKDIRVWELQPPSTAVPRSSFTFAAPILSCSFNTDASQVFSGACDNVVRLWDLNSNQVRDIGKHDSAVKEVKWVDALNMCVSGSWDKTLRWWDTRSPQATATIQLPERAYAMDVFDNYLIVACAGKDIVLFDMANPSNPLWKGQSSLKLESRTISLFPDKSGFGLGSSEARCSIQYFAANDQPRNFSFKCHRENGRDGRGSNASSVAYPVHAVSFHPTFGTFSTAGGDGNYHFWDKDARHKLCTGSKRQATAITSAKFSPDGNLFVFASGYDWSKGVEEYEKNIKNNPAKAPKIHIHVVKQEEVQPKASR